MDTKLTNLTLNRGTLCILSLATLAVAMGQVGMVSAQEPWGISSSAGSTRNVAEWFPKMSAVGVTSVRLFPEWRDIEPTRGMWKWDRPDTLVETAAKNKLEINAILM